MPLSLVRPLGQRTCSFCCSGAGFIRSWDVGGVHWQDSRRIGSFKIGDFLGRLGFGSDFSGRSCGRRGGSVVVAVAGAAGAWLTLADWDTTGEEEAFPSCF